LIPKRDLVAISMPLHLWQVLEPGGAWPLTISRLQDPRGGGLHIPEFIIPAQEAQIAST